MSPQQREPREWTSKLLGPSLAYTRATATWGVAWLPSIQGFPQLWEEGGLDTDDRREWVHPRLAEPPVSGAETKLRKGGRESSPCPGAAGGLPCGPSGLSRDSRGPSHSTPGSVVLQSDRATQVATPVGTRLWAQLYSGGTGLSQGKRLLLGI